MITVNLVFNVAFGDYSLPRLNTEMRQVYILRRNPLNNTTSIFIEVHRYIVETHSFTYQSKTPSIFFVVHHSSLFVGLLWCS